MRNTLLAVVLALSPSAGFAAPEPEVLVRVVYFKNGQGGTIDRRILLQDDQGTPKLLFYENAAGQSAPSLTEIDALEFDTQNGPMAVIYAKDAAQARSSDQAKAFEVLLDARLTPVGIDSSGTGRPRVYLLNNDKTISGHLWAATLVYGQYTTMVDKILFEEIPSKALRMRLKSGGTAAFRD